MDSEEEPFGQNNNYNNDEALTDDDEPKHHNNPNINSIGIMDHPVMNSFMKTASISGYAINPAEETKTIADAIVKVKFGSKIKFMTNDSLIYATGEGSLMNQVEEALKNDKNNNNMDIQA